jgi:hypothetical protein
MCCRGILSPATSMTFLTDLANASRPRNGPRLPRPHPVRGGGSLGHTALWGHLALGPAWPAAFAAAGLAIFWIWTRTHAR